MKTEADQIIRANIIDLQIQLDKAITNRDTKEITRLSMIIYINQQIHKSINQKENNNG